MKLPNAGHVLVERDKIMDYLLNPAHRFGASKARFFTAFGFRAEEWDVLAAALRKHAQTHDVAQQRETGHGPRFTVEGELDHGEVAPRLITAYPLESL